MVSLKGDRMHAPDGFINAPVSLGTGAVSASILAVALSKARAELDEKAAPMAGLVAAYVFAAQMLNFPVALGTSGHLMGGALAAILVGPWTGMIAVSTVVILQALLFADGGLTALGFNVFNMAIITVIAGWLVFQLVTKFIHGRTGVIVGAFLAALVSVPASASAFVFQYALGGTGTLDIMDVFIAMFSVHVLIGIGEGIITLLTVSAVLALRPDLVFGARGKVKAELEIRESKVS
jgi:cobalt/nickel transport system permease protein